VNCVLTVQDASLISDIKNRTSLGASVITGQSAGLTQAGGSTDLLKKFCTGRLNAIIKLLGILLPLLRYYFEVEIVNKMYSFQMKHQLQEAFHKL
jgi:hypothetical protein